MTECGFFSNLCTYYEYKKLDQKELGSSLVF